MPRSLAMVLLRRAAADASIDQAPPPKVGRRDVLLGSAVSAASLAMGSAPGLAASARIAVVGAGLAGLTAAYRLKQAGYDPVVFEGDTRVGGRCFSARNVFKDGQIAEHGGEFIDTTHYQIRGLAKELGLTLYDVLAAEPAGTTPIYRFNGQPYTLADATKDFQPLYPVLQAQNTALGNTLDYKVSTAAAKRLDAMTIAGWVAATVPGGRASRLGQLIENAFSEENAADTDRQSALNVIYTLAQNKRTDFELYYTGSDQRFRVAGGNDQIPTLLAAALGNAVKTGTALRAIRRLGDGRVALTLARDGAVRDAVFDRVILTVPFAVMRAAVDYGRAGFQPLKVKAIETLGMGSSVKFQLQFDSRLWDRLGCNGEIRLVSPAFQTTWDVSRGQSGASGIFNFWAGGSQALFDGRSPDREALARLCLAGADEILPGLDRQWNGRSIIDVWRQNPWSLGSYSYYPPGYQTTLYGIEKEPEGNCFFAGEHTWSEAGYLNAGVASGERAAGQVAKSLTS